MPKRKVPRGRPFQKKVVEASELNVPEVVSSSDGALAAKQPKSDEGAKLPPSLSSVAMRQPQESQAASSGVAPEASNAPIVTTSEISQPDTQTRKRGRPPKGLSRQGENLHKTPGGQGSELPRNKRGKLISLAQGKRLRDERGRYLPASETMKC